MEVTPLRFLVSFHVGDSGLAQSDYGELPFTTVDEL